MNKLIVCFVLAVVLIAAGCSKGSGGNVSELSPFPDSSEVLKVFQYGFYGENGIVSLGDFDDEIGLDVPRPRYDSLTEDTPKFHRYFAVAIVVAFPKKGEPEGYYAVWPIPQDLTLEEMKAARFARSKDGKLSLAIRGKSVVAAKESSILPFQHPDGAVAATLQNILEDTKKMKPAAFKKTFGFDFGKLEKSLIFHTLPSPHSNDQ